MTKQGYLYLCPTPIGNLGDVTLRTLEVLNEADLIACEDTRNSLKLLRHFEINKPLISYHEHNEKQMSEQLIHKLQEGQVIALITDAGMPGISDPGYELVQMAIAEEVPFTVLPGPSAVLTALVGSGLPVNRFIFEGFLPRKGKDREQILKAWENEERTIIFYESPHRLLKTLEEFSTRWPERPLATCRELTKKFEDIQRGTCASLYDYFSDHPIKGEFVLVLGKAEEKLNEEDRFQMALDYALTLMEAGERTKAAANAAAEKYDLSKRELYQAILQKK